MAHKFPRFSECGSHLIHKLLKTSAQQTANGFQSHWLVNQAECKWKQFKSRDKHHNLLFTSFSSGAHGIHAVTILLYTPTVNSRFIGNLIKNYSTSIYTLFFFFLKTYLFGFGFFFPPP